MTKMVELNSHIIKRHDGYVIQFVMDDGTTLEQEQKPFNTIEEATAALDEYLEFEGGTILQRAN